MSDKFQSVTSGQPIRLQAATWNAMLEAAKAHEQSKFDQRGVSESALRQPTLAKVRNQTGAPLQPFDVVGLAAPIITPAQRLSEFQRQTALEAGLPQSGVKFGILTEALPAGGIGTAVVAGVIAARVSVANGTYDCAEPLDSTVSHLRSVPHGPAHILWIESSLEPVRWALLRFDSSNREEIVYITSNQPDADGFYPAIVQEYDITAGQWSDRFACKVLDANQ